MWGRSPRRAVQAAEEKWFLFKLRFGRHAGTVRLWHIARCDLRTVLSSHPRCVFPVARQRAPDSARALTRQKDLVQAYQWFGFAGATPSQGQLQADALGNCDVIAREMTVAQIEEAKRRMKAWQPRMERAAWTYKVEN